MRSVMWNGYSFCLTGVGGWLILAVVLAPVVCVAADRVEGTLGNDGVTRVKLLPPGPGNPRNSEGDFIQLKSGRLLFVYTHFTAGASDHAQAHLAGRYSDDGGKSWTKDDVVVLPNEATQNIMSVSLLRLKNGRIALFYLRKNSLSDCRPLMRVSTDEAKTWGDPIELIPDEQIGYYVLNNDRVVQLRSGRLVVPVSQHYGRDQNKWTPYGRIRCYVSDDDGRTWKRGEAAKPAESPGAKPVLLQEPGVVELKDGRVMIFCRTGSGSQYTAYSPDGGWSWSAPKPSNIISPVSPASIERIPSTGDLLLVWNNHQDIDPKLRGKRTPFCVAVSRDEGKTWDNVTTLENNPHGWYCYTAVEFVGDHVLLGHCGGDRRHNNGLAETQVSRFPIGRLYR